MPDDLPAAGPHDYAGVAPVGSDLEAICWADVSPFVKCSHQASEHPRHLGLCEEHYEKMREAAR